MRGWKPSFGISKLLQYEKWALETILFKREPLSRDSDWKFHYSWGLQLDVQESSSAHKSVRNLIVCDYPYFILDTCFSVSPKDILRISNVWCHWKNLHCMSLLGHQACAPNFFDLSFPPRAVLSIRVWTEIIRNRIGPKMWFKLYVKNSKQLVFSVQFLKEITTCFYTTL